MPPFMFCSIGDLECKLLFVPCPFPAWQTDISDPPETKSWKSSRIKVRATNGGKHLVQVDLETFLPSCSHKRHVVHSLPIPSANWRGFSLALISPRYATSAKIKKAPWTTKERRQIAGRTSLNVSELFPAFWCPKKRNMFYVNKHTVRHRCEDCNFWNGGFPSTAPNPFLPEVSKYSRPLCSTLMLEVMVDDVRLIVGVRTCVVCLMTCMKYYSWRRNIWQSV